MRLRTFLSSVLPVVFLSVNCFAQRVQQQSNQTGWLLEVTYLKGAPPAYEQVRLPGSKVPGPWFARFGRVAGWQLPTAAKPIRAVRISNRLRDDRVRIRVSVLRGEKFLDEEQTVATYDLLENGRVSVKPLEKLGVEPFEIRVFKTPPLASIQPIVKNEIAAVEVIGIEAVASDMPEYKLTLRNLSMKSIEALRVDLMEGQREMSTGMPQGFEGRPLMLAGETVQVRIPMVAEARGTEGAYVPAVSLQQQYVIKSVVFGDGTTEGLIERDTLSAAGIQSIKLGRRMELHRVLPLLAAALESTDPISSEAATNLRSQLQKATAEIAAAELVDLQQKFPPYEARILKEWAEFGVYLMRKDLLDELMRFETNAHGKDFRSWLIENKERYSQWLERLEPVDAPRP